MNIRTFIENFSDQFDDTELSEFSATTNFRELDEWSSLTALAVLNMINKKYGKTVKADEMKDTETIQELYELVVSKS